MRKGKKIHVPAHNQRYKINQGKIISFKRALSVMKKRSPSAIKRDKAKKAHKTYARPNTLWLKNPGRSDVKGIDTPKKKKDSTFQMKNKKYKTSEVIANVRDGLKKTDGRKLNTEVNKEYKKQSEQALKKNPNWKMYYPSKEKYLNSVGVSKERIKKEKQGELIQQQFDKTIKRRVKADKSITDGKNLRSISDETLIKNLNVIRNTRKHEVGMKYNQNKKK